MKNTYLHICLLILATVLPAGAAVIHVPGEQPTIQAGIDAAGPGDSVVVACGTYHEHDITMASGVTLTSATGLPDCVTIDAQDQSRVMSCWGVDANASIIGFTITGGDTHLTGGGIFLSAGSPTIENCVLDGNRASGGGGLYCTDGSSPTVVNCLFVRNTVHEFGGGVFVYGTNNRPTFTGCTIIQNGSGFGGAGLAFIPMFGPNEGTLDRCTIRDNTSAGGAGGILASEADLVLAGCIIAFNGGTEGFSSVNSTLTLACCDIHGNEGGDWTDELAPMEGTDGNFDEDPLFCGVHGSGNAYLQEFSPCAPGQHPAEADCGLIGAWPVNCGGTAAEPATWSRVKSLY